MQMRDRATDLIPSSARVPAPAPPPRGGGGAGQGWRARHQRRCEQRAQLGSHLGRTKAFEGRFRVVRVSTVANQRPKRLQGHGNSSQIACERTRLKLARCRSEEVTELGRKIHPILKEQACRGKYSGATIHDGPSKTDAKDNKGNGRTNGSGCAPPPGEGVVAWAGANGRSAIGETRWLDHQQWRDTGLPAAATEFADAQTEEERPPRK